MSINYMSYFDKLPKIKYDVNHSLVNQKYETVTNIFFRLRFIQEVINNIDSYFVAEIEDGETPEIIAEKVYGDAGAAWMITVANNIIDPQWEWPLTYDQFNKYVSGKYTTMENAKVSIHHYEMVVTRRLMPDDITTERRYRIDKEKLTDNNLTVPHNYFNVHVLTPSRTVDSDHYTVDSGSFTIDNTLTLPDPTIYGLQPGSMAYALQLNTYNIDGKTVFEEIKGDYTTNYEYEEQRNDQHRFIKVIRKEYYDRIMTEFNEITDFSPDYIRRIR